MLLWVSITFHLGSLGQTPWKESVSTALSLKGRSFAVNIYTKQIGMYCSLYTVWSRAVSAKHFTYVHTKCGSTRWNPEAQCGGRLLDSSKAVEGQRWQWLSGSLAGAASLQYIHHSLHTPNGSFFPWLWPWQPVHGLASWLQAVPSFLSYRLGHGGHWTWKDEGSADKGETGCF